MSRDRWSRRRSLVEQALDLPQQSRQLDRLGIEVVTPHRQGVIAVAAHGVSGQRHDRDMAGVRRWLEFPRGVLTVAPRQTVNHTDQIGRAALLGTITPDTND